MKKDFLISLVILFLSLINIFFHQNQLISFSVGISVIGIIGFISFILKNNLYKTLFLIWILAQFPIIEVHEIKNGIKYVNPIFDLSQAFKIKIGFGLTYLPKTFYIGLNFIPFAYYALYKLLVANSLISSSVTIIPVSEQSPITKFAPFTAEIIDTEDGFLKAELSEIIEIEGNEYQIILFKTIDKSIFNLNKTRQKCFIKLIPIKTGIELQTEGFIK